MFMCKYKNLTASAKVKFKGPFGFTLQVNVYIKNLPSALVTFRRNISETSILCRTIHRLVTLKRQEPF